MMTSALSRPKLLIAALPPPSAASCRSPYPFAALLPLPPLCRCRRRRGLARLPLARSPPLSSPRREPPLWPGPSPQAWPPHSWPSARRLPSPPTLASSTALVPKAGSAAPARADAPSPLSLLASPPLCGTAAASVEVRADAVTFGRSGESHFPAS